MSVLIKGMKKPKDCYECRLHYCHGECGISDDGNCPIIELPDHGDLIDRDNIRKQIPSEELASRFAIENAYVVISAERNEG